jgi:hypothetical protein
MSNANQATEAPPDPTSAPPHTNPKRKQEDRKRATPDAMKGSRILAFSECDNSLSLSNRMDSFPNTATRDGSRILADLSLHVAVP